MQMPPLNYRVNAAVRARKVFPEKFFFTWRLIYASGDAAGENGFSQNERLLPASPETFSPPYKRPYGQLWMAPSPAFPPAESF
jgi:hypothetical protein